MEFRYSSEAASAIPTATSLTSVTWTKFLQSREMLPFQLPRATRMQLAGETEIEALKVLDLSLTSKVNQAKTNQGCKETYLETEETSTIACRNMVDIPPPPLIYFPQGNVGSHLNLSLGVSGQVISKQEQEQQPFTGFRTGRSCQVCGEAASGNFFGAVVCLPCKTFYIRCSSENARMFKCRHAGTCNVVGSQRSRCKACRYKKCMDAGMVRRVRPEHIEVTDGQQLCVVCGDISNGVHFGVTSCEGCKKFFRRGLQEYQTYSCKSLQACQINPKTRNDCRYCRYQKCVTTGMSRGAIKMGRPKKTGPFLPYDTVSNLSRYCHNQPHAIPEFLICEQQDRSYIKGPYSPPSTHPKLEFGPFRASTPTSPVYHPYTTSGRRSPPKSQASIMNLPDNKNLIQTLPRNNEPMNTPVAGATGVTGHLQEPKKEERLSSGDKIVIKREVEMDCDGGSESSASSGYCSDIDAENPNLPLDYSKRSDQTVPLSLRRLFGTATEDEELETSPKSPPSPTRDPEIENAVEKRVPYPLSTEDKDTRRNSGDEAQTKLNSSPPLPHKSEVLQYRLPANFWLRPNVSNSLMSRQSHQALIDTMLAAYRNLVTGFCKEEDESQSQGHEHLTKRIVDHTLLSMAFVHSIPEFSAAVPTCDKFTIFRLSGIQISILVAAFNLYDVETNTFSRNFYEQKLEPQDPMYDFRNFLLNFATELQSLILDDIEAAFLVALVAVGTDWPGLKNPAALDPIFQQMLATLSFYTTEKHDSSPEKLNSILAFVPRLRQLGQWHYDLTTQDVLAHY